MATFGFNQKENETETLGSTQSSSAGFTSGRSNTYLDKTQARQRNRLVNRFMRDDSLGGLGPGFDRNSQYTNQGQRQFVNQQQPYINKLRQSSNIGRNRLQQFSRQNNPYLNAQIQGIGQDIGQQFREQIMPGIGNQFQGAGQRGSSRQGVAEGIAARGAMDAFSQQANDLRFNAYGQQQAAAGQLASLGQQGAYQQSALQQQGLGQLADQTAQYGQLNMEANAQPFQIGAELIGDPAILSQSRDYSRQKSRTKTNNRTLSSGGGSGFNIG